MKTLLFKRYYPFLIIIILGITNVFTYCYFNHEKEEEPVIADISYVNDESNDGDVITVDIKGEVKKPGLYQLNVGSNINDLILAAGGLTKNGTTTNINLARKLTDQSVIIIKNKKSNTSKAVEKPCVCDTVEISNCDTSVIEITKSSSLEGEVTKVVDNTDSVKSTKISINNASKEELMTLTGIGEAKAVAIIEYRNQNGGFKTLEDLINVNGISENIYNKIKDFIEM